ncbi:hypothetical protein K504DRAFT_86045 [Pleomassaria siparia CBS 279.74]|uniref:Uncharacterized protein n=1 Tax=Pleomassaria siparia CBS 279.74 TaxID=1314801 RepID=A0A6G1JZW5_9PLEO|nr:hypothetical protein K504DRAFT_86045 [Pleomassaria siparia CBS 279.74]
MGRSGKTLNGQGVAPLSRPTETKPKPPSRRSLCLHSLECSLYTPPHTSTHLYYRCLDTLLCCLSSHPPLHLANPPHSSAWSECNRYPAGLVSPSNIARCCRETPTAASLDLCRPLSLAATPHRPDPLSTISPRTLQLPFSEPLTLTTARSPKPAILHHCCYRCYHHCHHPASSCLAHPPPLFRVADINTL